MADELDGETTVAPDATVTNFSLGENVQIHGNATVKNADLKRTVIFPAATITDATVENSIVDRESVVRGVDLDGHRRGANRNPIESVRYGTDRSGGNRHERLNSTSEFCPKV